MRPLQMAGPMSDTPTAWCPTCAPDSDEVAEFLFVEFCSPHRPSIAGLDDSRTGLGLQRDGEMTGEELRAACAVVHGTAP